MGIVKHGMSQTRQYRVWRHMQSRCLNPNVPEYKNYGGRGIKCEWKRFEDFWKDMGASFNPILTIDRIDNNGNYSKRNCRWASMTEQANNRRNAHLFKFKNQSRTLTEWAKILKVNRSRLSQRFYVYKWSVKKTLTI